MPDVASVILISGIIRRMHPACVYPKRKPSACAAHSGRQ